MTPLSKCSISGLDYRPTTQVEVPSWLGRLWRGARTAALVVMVVLALFALLTWATRLTPTETAIAGVWLTDPWEGGQYTRMSLQPGHRVEVTKHAADGKVTDHYRGTWSLRQEVLIVDTRPLWEVLPGIFRIETPGTIWEFSVRNGQIIQGPNAPKPIILHRAVQD